MVLVLETHQIMDHQQVHKNLKMSRTSATGKIRIMQVVQGNMAPTLLMRHLVLVGLVVSQLAPRIGAETYQLLRLHNQLRRIPIQMLTAQLDIMLLVSYIVS